MKRAAVILGLLATVAGSTIRCQDFTWRVEQSEPVTERHILFPWQADLREPPTMPADDRRAEWSMSIRAGYGLMLRATGGGTRAHIEIACPGYEVREDA